MAIYDDLGIRRVINADARLTRLGGSLMPDAVRRAMDDAARSYVDLDELHDAVGQRLAELTGNEAACVTTGAAAGLTLATLACMTGNDQNAIARLPDRSGLRSSIIYQRPHRIGYLAAVALSGARLIEIGVEPDVHPAELEAAIDEETAAVLFVAGSHLSEGALPLEEVVETAHARGVPVIVDAAAQLPPASNFWHFSRDLGADLVIFSGGKDLRGPQASGLVVGRPDLIQAIRRHGSPNPRLARGMKVGKEEMAGLLAAVTSYLALDHEARVAGFEADVASWIATLADVPGIVVEREFPNEAGQPMPRCRVTFTGPEDAARRDAVVAMLWDGDPRVAVKAVGVNAISCTPDTLEPGESAVVGDRVRLACHATLAN